AGLLERDPGRDAERPQTTGVDQVAVEVVVLLDEVDERSLVVGMERNDLRAELRARRADELLELAERADRAVDVPVATAEVRHVEAVQERDAEPRRRHFACLLRHP